MRRLFSWRSCLLLLEPRLAAERREGMRKDGALSHMQKVVVVGRCAMPQQDTKDASRLTCRRKMRHGRGTRGDSRGGGGDQEGGAVLAHSAEAAAAARWRPFSPLHRVVLELGIAYSNDGEGNG